MSGPRLRTVNKAIAPFELNKFPSQFIETFAKEIVYMQATKSTMSLEGNEWEQIFAECIGATWKPSNVGLDDIVLKNCCWGAKTVFGTSKIEKQKTVRLISGRNSPTYSYGIDRLISEDPNEIGKLVLDIWNERVSAVRQIYKFVRTVVLVKSKDFSEYLIFEFDTIRYDPELYYFKWNKNMNLEGYEKSTNNHKFTWQPSGSQFTIIENVPEKRLHISVKKPEHVDKETILKAVNFDNSWYKIISEKREDGILKYKRKLLNSQTEESIGYGAGSGTIERYEYECPCGKGIVVEEHDNIPGFRDHNVYIQCDECRKDYSIDISEGVRNWKLKKN